MTDLTTDPGRPVTDRPAGDPRAERLKETLSTVLDVTAMVAVAVGVGWGLWPVWGGWALTAAGLSLLFMSAVAATAREPKPSKPVVDSVLRRRAPGPDDPGSLHIFGGNKP